MSTKYFALLTQLGADKLANAAALGTKLAITQMAVGDGGGVLPTPDTTQTKLVNERRRATINTLNVDPKNAHQIIAEQVIPESEGGWWIREIGLFDQDGVLIAVGNCPETYKPQLQEGSGRTQTIRMVLIVSHTDAVTLKIDPSVVLATREYTDTAVKKAIDDHEKSRRHPDATLKEKGLVILSSALDSQSEKQAATPKAVKAAYDLATKANQSANDALEKAKNGADIPNKAVFVENLGLSKTVELAGNAYPKTGGTIEGKVFTNSDIDAKGWVGGNRLYERFDNGKRANVYSERYPPTSADVGAYSIQEVNDQFALKISHDYFTCGGVHIEATHQYAGIRLIKPDGYFVQFSANPNDDDPLTIYYRQPDGNTLYWASLPKKSGQIAMTSDFGYSLIAAGEASLSKRVIFDNPFGGNSPVIVTAEIYLNGIWGDPGFIYSTGAGEGYGTRAAYVEGKGIYLTCGGKSLMATDSTHSGNPFGNKMGLTTSAPCRIHVWRIVK
ncbi:phage tail protein [Xenorhabdus sp. ZM]|uniref:phage tail protein n=1 Tax=Xenorhabdus szentirmaii TaxID=290112 RepID=UPI0019B9A1BB|nr:phage tail protein [Xenorhabdus sp. ZM]MBD2804152.1 phage tail protein [Xenorhabdus sp. ZM]